MFHYVRDTHASPFPAIKARSIAEFRGQLDYCRRHYHIIHPADLLQVIRQPNLSLPRNSLLLTFDDGYMDHYKTVWPILADLHLAGVFAPVAKAVLDNQVLDVNKIHFILAAMDDRIPHLVQDLFNLLDDYRTAHELPPNDAYWSRLAKPSRFDSAEVIFIKRMLQRDLPENLRSLIGDKLFRRYVTVDEKAFAAELYMSLPQLKEMAQAGMCIASHSHDHYWLGTLPPDEQDSQVEKSIAFLRQVASVESGWVFTYPFGSFNDHLVTSARRRGCVAGFTTEVNVATGKDDPLLLPRLDTNDLPTEGNAAVADWTRKAFTGNVL